MVVGGLKGDGSTFMATAAPNEKAKPRELSFKATLQALTAFRDSMREADAQKYARLWEAMFVVIGYHRVGDRPGRVEPRCKKRRPKPYRKFLFRVTKGVNAYSTQLSGYYSATPLSSSIRSQLNRPDI